MNHVNQKGRSRPDDYRVPPSVSDGASSGYADALSNFSADNMSPNNLLQLQRLIGNQATQQVITRQYQTSLNPQRVQHIIHRASTINRIPLARIQRKGGGVGGGTATGEIGIPDGESSTPSDISGLAKGYFKLPGGDFHTPDKRTVSEAQAKDESKVINSDGIYMAAYLARYNHVKDTYHLANDVMAELSSRAGFMKQFKTGDIVLRQMDASESEGISKITSSQYSHTGIIQVRGGQVWVLDSYPRGSGKDASVTIPFEEFYSDHHGEKIVNGMVLRLSTINKTVRSKIDKLIDKYDLDITSFDRKFLVDNGDDVLYCSELVTRILMEAGASTLPDNEFADTQKEVESLIAQLELYIKLLDGQGTNSDTQKEQLQKLNDILSQFKGASTKEMYSPGSYERAAGFDTVAGFGRGAEINGTFKVTVVEGIVPESGDETDAYVELSGGVSGTTSTVDDTTAPRWNDSFSGINYEDLKSVTFAVKDSDFMFDDDIETITADIRPVKPSGQTFELEQGSTTLYVKVEGENTDASVAGQAPRDLTPM